MTVSIMVAVKLYDMDRDYEISRGDVRLNDMKIVRNGAIIEYKASSIVNDGDVDVNALRCCQQRPSRIYLSAVCTGTVALANVLR
ncbi:MAG: hypothetical protein R2883_03175 [Caldisericia bacterium]